MKVIYKVLLSLVAIFSLIVLVSEKTPDASWQELLYWKGTALLCLLLSAYLLVGKDNNRKGGAT